MTRVVLFLITLYQRILSPYIGGQCRFYPSCSNYARLAYEHDGFFYGTFKTVWRILRCNPLSKGGIDFP